MKRTYLFILVFASILVISTIYVAAQEEALLKVVETPVRPSYTELPGFGAAAFLLSIMGLAIYYAFTKKINKKGVSPIIATVLLVAMTIAMFLAVFTFSKSFVKEQVEKAGGPIETSCQIVSYNALLSGNKALITNTGNVVLYGFNVKTETSGRTTMNFLRTENGKVGSGETDNLELGGLANYDKVTLIPVLLGRGTNSGSGKLYPCNDASRVLK